MSFTEDPSNAIRNEVRDFANKHGLTFFNPREHSGLLRTLMLRTASTGEIMVLIQFFETIKPRELIRSSLREIPETSLQYVINSKQMIHYTILILSYTRDVITY
jgi:23S rRNA (uracil1939-C5)-methyltransferase